MSAATKAPTETRNVRVTVEGTARPVKHDSRYLFIKHGEHSFLVNAEAEGVTVEDVVPERTWTDGDVVQNHVHGWTLTRDCGQWVLSTGKASWLDDEVAEALNDSDGLNPYRGELTVLRYQAGESL